MDRARAAAPPDWLTAWIDEVPRGKALDIGAGEGDLALWLSERGFTVEAVENEESAARRLRRKAQGRSVKVVETDMEDYRIPSEEYTLVLAAASLHFLHPDDLEPLAGRLVAALRPGGYLMTEVFTTDDPGADHYRQEGVAPIAPNTYPIPGRKGIIHYFEPGELRRVFHPLEVLEYEESRRVSTEDEAGYRAGALLIARRPREG